MGSVVLKKGREESLRRFHPWIFSGAVESVSGNLREGDAVDVLAHDGSFLASRTLAERFDCCQGTWFYG